MRKGDHDEVSSETSWKPGWRMWNESENFFALVYKQAGEKWDARVESFPRTDDQLSRPRHYYFASSWNNILVRVSRLKIHRIAFGFFRKLYNLHLVYYYICAVQAYKVKEGRRRKVFGKMAIMGLGEFCNSSSSILIKPPPADSCRSAKIFLLQLTPLQIFCSFTWPCPHKRWCTLSYYKVLQIFLHSGSFHAE